MTDSTLAERIVAVASRSGSTPFLRLLSADEMPTELSYLTLLQQASLWSRIYSNRGLRPRQRVVILLRHSADLYASFLGALLSGLIPALLAPPSPKLSMHRFQATMRSLLPTTRPDAVVVGAELYEMFASDSALRVITTREAFGVQPPESLTMEASGSGKDTAFLQYSSGTTGLRKGVEISHFACLQQVDLYASALNLTSADSIVSWLPLYHDMGLIACWMMPLLTGPSVTAMSPFDWVARPSMLTRAIRTYRPTLCWLPNFAFSHLARSVGDADLAPGDMSSVRAFINCSEPISDAAHEAFLAKFSRAGAHPGQIAACYAMAEATFAITTSRPGSPPSTLKVDPASIGPGSDVRNGPKALVSSGRPISGTKVRIVDDRGQTSPDGRVGEIRVTSPSVTTGYLANPKATRAALQDGELNTADLGFVANGELFVLGRADDTILQAGRNLFPQDIEAVVEAVAGVVPGRSVAFGIADDDEGTAHVVIVAEGEALDAPRRQALARQISTELVARLDVAPRSVHIVDRGWLVKSTSGKISRRLNRERYLAELGTSKALRSTPSATGLPLVDFVRSAVASALGGEVPSDDESLLTGGRLDSLALTTLLLVLGERFGENLPMPNVVGFHRFDTIGSLCALLGEVEHGFKARSRDTIYAARDVKLRSFGRSTAPLDLLILGSSTSFAIPCWPSAVAGLSAFNLSVNAATIADLYCLMRFALDRRGSLGRVVIGLDVFAFKPRDALVLEHRTVDLPELTRYLAPEDQAIVAELRDAALRSSQGQRINLQRMAEWQPERWYSFDDETGDVKLGQIETGDTRSELARHGIEPKKHEMAVIYNGFEGLCPRQTAYLAEIVAVAAARNIRLELVVMPLHADLHGFLAQTAYPARRAEILDLVAPLRSPLINIHDLPVPSAFGGDEGDFEDAYHLGTINSERLLRHVLSS